MRKVLCVSSSKRISSFITITSPVSRCVTWVGAQGLSHPRCHPGEPRPPPRVALPHLDGLAEAALAQNLSVDEVGGAEDAVGSGHDTQGLGAPEVLALRRRRAHGARARGLVRAAAPPAGWTGWAGWAGWAGRAQRSGGPRGSGDRGWPYVTARWRMAEGSPQGTGERTGLRGAGTGLPPSPGSRPRGSWGSCSMVSCSRRLVSWISRSICRGQ